MNPPSQSSTEALHTITLLIYIERREMNPPGQLIIEALHTLQFIYRKEMNPPGPSSIKVLHCYTLYIYRMEMKPLVNRA